MGLGGLYKGVAPPYAHSRLHVCLPCSLLLALAFSNHIEERPILPSTHESNHAHTNTPPPTHARTVARGRRKVRRRRFTSAPHPAPLPSLIPRPAQPAERRAPRPTVALSPCPIVPPRPAETRAALSGPAPHPGRPAPSRGPPRPSSAVCAHLPNVLAPCKYACGRGV